MPFSTADVPRWPSGAASRCRGRRALLEVRRAISDGAGRSGGVPSGSRLRLCHQACPMNGGGKTFTILLLSTLPACKFLHLHVASRRKIGVSTHTAGGLRFRSAAEWLDQGENGGRFALLSEVRPFMCFVAATQAASGVKMAPTAGPCYFIVAATPCPFLAHISVIPCPTSSQAVKIPRGGDLSL